ncbi:hypothetical protein [Brevibacterium sp. ZH18]|uniref:hypothetical protein n=1 Tax=Brevibacterium sp. ZH18 TaxID=2927784 RepID=UPI001F602871|nr:hypothetical protein [Brevibacterium sp. ZH18]MCI4012858.1 hypothetical protein [Brevibacterium sp. ZH18]
MPFPSRVRFAAAPASYAIGSIAGEAFALAITKALVASTGTTTSAALYPAGATAIMLAPAAQKRGP